MEPKDDNISAMCKPAVGEAGKTGDWRDLTPVIDHAKCIASVKNRPACYLCWLYCPDGIVSAGIPVKIDLDYCKGCGICSASCPQQAVTIRHFTDEELFAQIEALDEGKSLATIH